MTEEQEKQESQKTLVAFVAGLLIGGLLVWVFGGTPQDKKKDENSEVVTTSEEMSELGDENKEANSTPTEETERPQMKTGDGEVEVADQAAGSVVKLTSATFPSAEGWIGVRSFSNEQVGSILGVSRYSESQGLIPTEVELLVPTVAGRTYAVTFFGEDGDLKFNPAYDVQMNTEISTFVAQ